MLPSAFSPSSVFWDSAACSSDAVFALVNLPIRPLALFFIPSTLLLTLSLTFLPANLPRSIAPLPKVLAVPSAALPPTLSKPPIKSLAIPKAIVPAPLLGKFKSRSFKSDSAEDLVTSAIVSLIFNTELSVTSLTLSIASFLRSIVPSALLSSFSF